MCVRACVCVGMLACGYLCTTVAYRVCVSGFDLKKSSVHGVMSPGAIISPKVENCTKTESFPSADRLQPSISVVSCSYFFSLCSAAESSDLSDAEST